MRKPVKTLIEVPGGMALSGISYIGMVIYMLKKVLELIIV